jgi:hypothetical protein
MKGFECQKLEQEEIEGALHKIGRLTHIGYRDLNKTYLGKQGEARKRRETLTQDIGRFKTTLRSCGFGGDVSRN